MNITTSPSLDRSRLPQADAVAVRKVSLLEQPGQQDAQKQTAGGLAAAYGVEISDAGRQLQAVEKEAPTALPDGWDKTPASSIEIQDVIEPTPNEGPIFFLTDDNWAEVESLACNMETIERYISGFMEDPKKRGIRGTS